MTPSLCGNNLSDKRSVVAFTWTITTLLTIIAFMVSIGLIINVHAQYNWHSNSNSNYNYNNRYLEGDGDGNNNHGSGSGDNNKHSGDDNKNGEHNDENEYQEEQAAAFNPGGMSFVAFYIMMIAMALSLYGTTAIVGFTSLHGDYIAPCFSSSTSSSMKLGMFGGAIVLYANLLLVCAVFFGEITVKDNTDNHNENNGEDIETETEIERCAAILGVTCMFLAALYSIFSVLLFLFFGSIEGEELDEDGIIGTKPLNSIAIDPRRENFITLGEPS